MISVEQNVALTFVLSVNHVELNQVLLKRIAVLIGVNKVMIRISKVLIRMTPRLHLYSSP